jgi:ADP-ribose diphosphatase
MRAHLKPSAEPNPLLRSRPARRPGVSSSSLLRVSVTPPATIPDLPRRVSARVVRYAGDADRFRLEEWTTAIGNGTATRDCVWVRGSYALVVAVANDRVVCIRQYKKAAQHVLLALPWGGIEEGESPLDAGRRELEEETGFSFHSAEVHGPFYDLPDKSTGGHWVVVARHAFRSGQPTPDEGELIVGTELIPVRRLWQHRFPVLMHVGALRLAGL